MNARLLGRLPLFRGLPHEDLVALCGVLMHRTYSDGEMIFQEGERAKSCHVITIGRVDVAKRVGVGRGRDELLTRLGPGSLVGELALIDGKPRSATARASGGLVATLELTRADFDLLFNANKYFAFVILDRIVVDLSKRLRAATSRLVEIVDTDADAEGRTAKAREVARHLLGEGSGLGPIDEVVLSVPPARR